MYIAAFHRKFGIINMGFIFSEVTKLLRLLYYTQMPDKLNSFFGKETNRWCSLDAYLSRLCLFCCCKFVIHLDYLFNAFVSGIFEVTSWIFKWTPLKVVKSIYTTSHSCEYYHKETTSIKSPYKKWSMK